MSADAAMTAVGTAWLVNSPVFSYDGEALLSYFRILMRDDPAGLVTAAESLQWLPLNDQVHRTLARFVQREFGGWRGRVQKDANNKRSKTRENSQQIAALFPQLNAALSQLTNKKDIKIGKAPNKLAATWANIMHAASLDNWREATKHLESLVTMIPEVQNEPFFGAYVDTILSLRSASKDAYSQQIAILQAVLATWQQSPSDSAPLPKYLLERFATSRRDWPNRIPSNDKDQAMELNAVLGATLLTQGNNLDRDVLEYFLQTRSGRGWNEVTAGQEVMGQLLESGAIFASNYLRPGYRATVPTIMAITRNEFPTLASQYPVETWFDQAYITEAKQKQVFDAKYWEFGRDADGQGASSRHKYFRQRPNRYRCPQQQTATTRRSG